MRFAEFYNVAHTRFNMYNISLSLSSHFSHIFPILKVKQSLHRPGQAMRDLGGSGSQISRQSEHEGGKVGNPKDLPSLPSENIPGTHFC